MGYYIETGSSTGKAKYLIDNEKAIKITRLKHSRSTSARRLSWS